MKAGPQPCAANQRQTHHIPLTHGSHEARGQSRPLKRRSSGLAFDEVSHRAMVSENALSTHERTRRRTSRWPFGLDGKTLRSSSRVTKPMPFVEASISRESERRGRVVPECVLPPRMTVSGMTILDPMADLSAAARQASVWPRRDLFPNGLTSATAINSFTLSRLSAAPADALS